MLLRTLILVATIAAWPAVAFADQQLLRLGCGFYPPFIDPNKPQGGLLSELLIEAGKIAGYRFEFVDDVPWARLIEEVKLGIYDGLSCSTLTDERKHWLAFTGNAFVHDRVALFGLKSRNLSWNNFNQLKNYRIIALRGTAYHKSLEEINQNNFDLTQFEEEALKMIASSRSDLYLSGYLSTMTALREYHKEWQEDIVPLQKYFSEDPLHPSITRKRPDAEEITAKLSAAFDQMDQSGQKSAIFEKHQVPE